MRAVQRADNAGPHTLAASFEKAFTSASAKNNTLAMMEGAQKNPAAAKPRSGPSARTADYPLDDWAQVIQVNLSGARI